MNNSRKTKFLKTGGTENSERISNLPDVLISHILSCLPTKDAVRTCVLSKDWEYKWSFIYNIDIDDVERFSKSSDVDEKGYFVISERYKANFANFVERVLLHTQNVRNFTLCCHWDYDLSRVAGWISAILRRNIESFVFKYDEDGIVFPRSLLNNTSLRKLEIWSITRSRFRVSANNCFPNLTSLFLHDVEIRNENYNIDRVTFTFPVLETIKFRFCRWSNMKLVEIYAPALISYKTENDCCRVDDYSIKLIATRLEFFETTGDILENIILTSSPVVSAILENNNDSEEEHLIGKRGLQVRRLLKASSSVKELTLAWDLVKVMVLSKLQLPLPTFDQLVRLTLHSSVYTEGLFELLHAAPCLRFLDMDVNDVEDWGDYDYDVEGSVPSCVVSHLEEVRLKDFEGRIPQYQLAGYFMRNGVALKRLYVEEFSPRPNPEIVEQLSRFSKSSTCLTIVMH